MIGLGVLQLQKGDYLVEGVVISEWRVWQIHEDKILLKREDDEESPWVLEKDELKDGEYQFIRYIDF